MTWLQAKTLGLPRWAWATLIAGGIGIGLYIRRRSAGEEEATPPEETPAGVPQRQVVGGNVQPSAAGSIFLPESKPPASENKEPVGEERKPESEKPEVPAAEAPQNLPEEEERGAPVAPAIGPPVHAETIHGPETPRPGPSVGPAVPVAGPSPPPVHAETIHAPTGIDGHPNAVSTGNPCVKGGVGGHSAPAGYHLFCASNGEIWRAPN